MSLMKFPVVSDADGLLTAQASQTELNGRLSPCPVFIRECSLLFLVKSMAPLSANSGNGMIVDHNGNVTDWISRVTKKPTRAVDFLARNLDYQAIKRNPSLLAVAEIKALSWRHHPSLEPSDHTRDRDNRLGSS